MAKTTTPNTQPVCPHCGSGSLTVHTHVPISIDAVPGGAQVRISPILPVRARTGMCRDCHATWDTDSAPAELSTFTQQIERSLGHPQHHALSEAAEHPANTLIGGNDTT